MLKEICGLLTVAALVTVARGCSIPFFLLMAGVVILAIKLGS
jgi:hypothetical protein